MLKLLLAFIFIISGCAHQKNNNPGQFPTYNESVKNLELSSSFAFTSGGHDYYFVRSRAEEYVGECWRFDGYKDNQLYYSFPAKHLQDLETIYSSEEDIEVKISKAIKLIDSFSPRILQCDKKKPTPSKPLLESAQQTLAYGLEIVVYGSIIVAFSPIIVPMSVGDAIAEKARNDKLQAIRLGFSEEQVNKIINFQSKREEFGAHIVQTFEMKSMSVGWHRWVFVYKNDKLIAYVWGLRP